MDGIIALPSAPNDAIRDGTYARHPVIQTTEGAAYYGTYSLSLIDSNRVPGYPFFHVSRFFPYDVTTNNGVAALGGIATHDNRIQVDVSGGFLRYIRVGSSTVTTQVPLENYKWHTVVCIGRSPTDASLTLNGQLVGTSSASVTFNAPWTRAWIGCIGGDFAPLGTLNINAQIALSAWLPSTLSDAQGVALSANPWQLFRAEPVRIYSLPSGAITLNSLTASNITQTGARITLGLTR